MRCRDAGLCAHVPPKSTPHTHRQESNVMYRIALPALMFLSACVQDGVTLYNPFNGQAVTTLDPQGFSQRRADVEVVVKSQFDAVLADIARGSGPALTAAMDAAQIAPTARAARVEVLQVNLPTYRASPDALIAALVPLNS